MQMTQYRLFFSWQNDRTEIKAVISSALKKVADKFAKENVELVIEQDTRGRVGVRNIAIEVLDKIRNCDIFVADLTPITTYIPKDSNRPPKLMPNSNVMFELGYALHVKGENHVIALASLDKKANEHIEFLPFDVNHMSITLFTDANSLSRLGDWIKNIIEHVDEERATYVPEYACSLLFQSSENLTNEITISPQYKRILYVRRNEAQQPIGTSVSPQWINSIFQTRDSFQLLFGNRLTFPPKVSINCSLVPLHIVLKNQGTEALDNLKIQIVANHNNITFTDSNRVSPFSPHEIIKSDGLTINDKSITQQYLTINPDDTLSLGTIFIHVPHDLDKLELHWKLTSRHYKEEGILHINVSSQYFIDYKEDNFLADTENVEDYIKME